MTMAKSRDNRHGSKPAPKPQPQPQKSNNWMPVLAVILAFIAYTPVFKADFVTWDDPDYVTNNQVIRSFSNLKEIVTTPVQGNYHPLTMLSLAINWAISGKDATSYHVVNLLLHLLNVLLVFFLVMRLSGRKPWIAFLTALLFGLHPLHVESVAWVAERKDVLYTVFFLWALIAYLKFLEKPTVVKYGAVLVLFLLSLLSKPAAIIFPIVLFAIDFYKQRKFTLKTLGEKVPLLALSLIFGLLTLHGQSSAGAVAGASTFPSHFRIFFGFYGILMYLIKTIFPFNLCTFYPFPAINSALPVIYLISPLMTAALAGLFFYTRKKARLVAFGILFFLINLALVLQFLPVGSAIIADRYTYIPLIGIFLIAGYYFQLHADRNNGKPAAWALGVLVVVTISLTLLCFRQAETWKSGEALWEQALKVAPSSRAYTNRGLIYKLDKNYDKALEMYSQAIRMNKAEKDALVNRGNIYFNRKQYAEAIADYNACLAIDPKQHLAIENRGAAYASTGKYELALADMNQALQLKPQSLNGYANRAVVLQILGKQEEAIADFKQHMVYSPDETGAIWNAIGTCYLRMQKNDEAIENFSKALTLREDPMYLTNRAMAYANKGKITEARADVQKAVKLGGSVDPALLNRLR
jgi:protein O-mannosyl-transferase